MSSLTIEVETSSRENRHKQLARWVEDVAQMCRPDRIHWCDGSQSEDQAMRRLMILSGTALPWMRRSARTASSSGQTPRT